MNEVLLDGGYVYITVLTQPYLRVEENTDVLSMYNRIIENIETVDKLAVSRLFYHHLAEYGTAIEDGQTLVWRLENGQRHDQDEALIREVCRFPGNSPTFGCGCYAAYPGTLFKVSRELSGHDYEGLHALVLQEIEKRGGSSVILETGDIRINDIEFP